MSKNNKKNKNKYINKKNTNNKSENNNKSVIIWISCITILIIVSLFAFNKDSDSTPSAVSTEATQFDLTDRPFTGEETAKVTLVEFGDFKCPACKAWSEQILPQIEKEFIETGKAKLYFMNLPIISGGDSKTIMQAARSVYKQDPNSFWTIYKKLYELQPDESLKWGTSKYLTKLISDYTPNIDINKVKEDLKNDTYLKDVNSDNKQAENANVNSTPTIFINGKKINNSFDIASIREEIELQLANE